MYWRVGDWCFHEWFTDNSKGKLTRKYITWQLRKLFFSFHSVELNISFYVLCMSEYVDLKLSKKNLGKFIKIVAEGEREVISAWKSCTKAPFNNKLHSDYHLSVKNSHRVLMVQINQYQGTKQGIFYQGIPYLRYFDIVFQRPYRYFSIALKVILSLSDRYKIFTSDWL